MAFDSDGRWYAGIGDPSAIGWITVGAYVVSTALAARNATAAKRSGVPVSFWLMLGAAMLLLALNKQLDLQSWLGQTGRDMAKAQGWYESRRVVQTAFVVGLGLGALAALLWARRHWSGLWAEYRWVFAGLTLLVVFIFIRASSFHHFDKVIGINLGVTTIGRALELTGIVVIGAACAQWHAMHRHRVREFTFGRGPRRR